MLSENPGKEPTPRKRKQKRADEKEREDVMHWGAPESRQNLGENLNRVKADSKQKSGMTVTRGNRWSTRKHWQGSEKR